MEENNEEVAEETTSPTSQSEPTLTIKDEPETPPVEATPDDFKFDDRIFVDNEFSKDGLKEYIKEATEREEKKDKRIQDMRKLVSTKDDFVEDKGDYFLDYAPPEKYMEKYFSENVPEETQKEIKVVTDLLAEAYNDNALNKAQARNVSNTVLEVLEHFGVLDTRTDDEIALSRQKWVEGQKAKLGANANEIIKEAQIYIGSENAFDKDVKGYMLEMIDVVGAPFIDVINQIKDRFGGATGGVPSSVVDLSGLGTDAELKQEYLAADTTDFRRQQITKMRAQAGRTSRLMDAQL